MDCNSCNQSGRNYGMGMSTRPSMQNNRNMYCGCGQRNSMRMNNGQNMSRPQMNHPSMENKCPCKQDGCDIGTAHVDKMQIAMAYVPWQSWKDIYDYDKAFERGTIFEELDKPYLGRPVR